MLTVGNKIHLRNQPSEVTLFLVWWFQPTHLKKIEVKLEVNLGLNIKKKMCVKPPLVRVAFFKNPSEAIRSHGESIYK